MTPAMPGPTLLTRLLRVLSKSLGEGGPVRPSRAPSPEGIEPVTAEQAPSAFDEQLRSVLSRNRATVGGRVHLLNLSHVAEHYGERWPQLSEKVGQLVALTLSRRLSSRDFFTRAKEGVYVILFDGLSEVEAKLKCALLAEEISSKLIGQGTGMQGLQVRSAVTRVDGSVAFDPFSTVDALDDVLRDAEARTTGPSRPGGEPPDEQQAPQWQAITALLRAAEQEADRGPMLPETAAEAGNRIDNLLALLRQAESVLVERHAARARALLAATDAEAADEQVAADPEIKRIAAFCSLIRRLEEDLKQRRSADAAPGEDAALAESAEVAFRYQPLWHTPNNVINAYMCAVGLKCGNRFVPGAEILPSGAEPMVLAALDRLVLRKAIDDIQLLIEARRENVIVVPVHHTTLTGGAAQRDYLAVCNSIQPQLRGYIVWEIVNPIIGFISSHIPPAVALLRRYGRAVLLRLDLEHPRLEDFLNIGLYAVGAEIKDSGLPQADLIRRMELFRARAERYGLRTYLHGLHSLSLTAAAFCAGYEYIGGEAIAGPTERPGGILVFGLEDVYAQNYRELPFD